ncbi:MAG: peptidoglycan-binding domain-containing protein [Candidatus Rokuibacteriota bacterium]
MTIRWALGWLRDRIGRPAVFFPVVTGVALLSVYGFIEGGLAMTDRLEGDLMRRMAYYRDQEPTVLVTRYEERLRAVRAALMKRGYNTGPTDAAMGPRTAEALRSFQRRQGLHVTGRPDSATVAALGLER